ncbi:coiled-coil domain-containing protein 130-like protein [Dinothrombium tinctorium]|uniref:Coiled-coil domain-containing protein 130-like protein n=1 Tax=Dinothrombium tinctorium TaxID=1965070 RepID=A0A3S3P8U2_9ACAR|nr:coiled-coil domain-containing protein 130-like protein [Dinothrombium tinctorium]RWS03560.1 coiled-coil domain-containing protein 130-like protein [Dinothrombium tinctorium]RWS17986.1 coiled-coil domain-containing protein 130-like protein [Dinothrombium tinctorium]
MAERKAVNKYYPSDFDPRKHGSINKYRGTHPLRERARKLHEGILIIRFEMPYNIWCDGCNNHIGMGVRYNAQKSKTGMYYSTPIYKFRMKCHLCDNHIEMQTDPKNLDYMILSGARRQERRWNPSENEQIVPEDKDTSKKLSSDAMFRLEHNVEHENKANTIAPVLEQLEQFQQRWKDDYAANQLLRNKFRVKLMSSYLEIKSMVKLIIFFHQLSFLFDFQTKKKETLEMENKNNAFLRKKNLLDSGIKLIAESEEDAKLASLMKLESIECK